MIKSHFVYLVSRLSRMIYQISNNCIFCKIASNDAKATIVYREEQVTAFRDMHPVAPTHILIIPNRHIESVGSLKPEDEPLVGHIFSVARDLAEQEGVSKGGYRIITNTGPHGGQTVFHLHDHLTGAESGVLPFPSAWRAGYLSICYWVGWPGRHNIQDLLLQGEAGCRKSQWQMNVRHSGHLRPGWRLWF